MGPPSQKPFDFSEEFTLHHRALWLVGLSVVANTADADDVMQEAAIIGLRKQATFQPGTSFRAWMGEIVRNVALNRRRQSRRELSRFGQRTDVHNVDLPRTDTPRHPVAPDGRLLPSQEALDDRMCEALMRLDPVSRACLLLRTVDGLGYDQISELMSIPKGTAMSNVFRARHSLAQLLTEKDAPTA
ncbi:MAG: RNA polymerase sigma factor [Phycisphaerales bacterium]|nr:RNA polymerase sigma factor [Phycisphaerales bacterium]